MKKDLIIINEPLLVDSIQASRLCGITRGTWYKLNFLKKTPAKIKLGNCSRWSLEKIKMWIRLECPNQKQLEILIKKANRKLYLKNKKALTDNYVKQILCDHNNLKHKDIPKALIELKREVIKINRLLKKERNRK